MFSNRNTQDKIRIEDSLIDACQKGNFKLVQHLIKDEYRKDISKHPNIKLFFKLACESGNLELVKYLIKQGADVNIKDEFGSTASDIACRSGNLELVKYLIEEGQRMDIDIQNNEGETILFPVCREHEEYGQYMEILKYLVDEKGMDVLRYMFR